MNLKWCSSRITIFTLIKRILRPFCFLALSHIFFVGFAFNIVMMCATSSIICEVVGSNDNAIEYCCSVSCNTQSSWLADVKMKLRISFINTTSKAVLRIVCVSKIVTTTTTTTIVNCNICYAKKNNGWIEVTSGILSCERRFRSQREWTTAHKRASKKMSNTTWFFLLVLLFGQWQSNSQANVASDIVRNAYQTKQNEITSDDSDKNHLSNTRAYTTLK